MAKDGEISIYRVRKTETEASITYDFIEVAGHEKRLLHNLGHDLWQISKPVVVTFNGGESYRFEPADVADYTPRDASAYAAGVLRDALKLAAA